MSVNDSRPVSELFADALTQFSKLMRNELQLARAEMSMKVGQAMTAIGLLAGAAILSIPTLVLLLMSLAAWLVEIGVRPSIAHLIAGVVGLLVVAILAGIGLNRLKTNSLVPRRTLDQLQQDATAAREHV
jgi:uncharacterized membrane protein YqjE